MGVKLNQSTNTWDAFFSKRHPLTRKSIGLRRKNIKSKSEALRIEKELVLEVENKLRASVTPTWSIVLNEFIEKNPNNLKAKTVYDYTKCLEAHTSLAWDNRFIDSIQTDEIRVLLKDRVGNRSPGHQKYMLKCIRTIFNYALNKGLIDRNPVPNIKFKLGDKIGKVLTEDQVRILLSKAREYNVEWYPHWIMAVYTGLRNGELYALKWTNVDIDQRKIIVNCAWNNKDGFKATKSEDDRIVEIAPNLVSFLKELKLQTQEMGFVLPRLDKWDSGEQARDLRMFLLGVGLPVIRFHDLRATWATLLLTKGVEPIKVMKMGGWKSIETMMIYIRKAGIDIKGATDCLNLHDSASLGKVLKFGERNIS